MNRWIIDFLLADCFNSQNPELISQSDLMNKFTENAESGVSFNRNQS